MNTAKKGAIASSRHSGGTIFIPNIPPVADAGINQDITLPTSSVLLTGTAIDPGGIVSSVLWTKSSGPSGLTITTPTLLTTTVTGLVAGTYVFTLTATDNLGSTGSDSMIVVVFPTPPVNQPPIANAGIDQTITSPASSVTLAGSGIDSDGTIVGYLWTRISGPNTPTIVSSTSATTSVTGLIVGTYIFQLQVTDNLGATGIDTIQVIVAPPPPPPPTANIALASAPTVPVTGTAITLPTSSVSLVDASVSPGYPIAVWAWTKISGPNGSTITTPSASATTITGLVQGTYVYQLQVWIGAPWNFTGTTTITITVNPSVGTGRTFYVSTTGDDTRTVSQAQNITTPWKTLQKATSSGLVAGDTVLIRGGVYRTAGTNSTPVHFNIVGLSGTASLPITIAAYPGEVPIYNLDNIVPTTDYAYGMVLNNCRYMHIKGHIIIKNLKQVQTGQGISRGFDLLNSSNNIVEWVEVFNMAGTGIILEDSADNLFLNCDSHHNGDGLSADSGNPPGSDAWDNADGFSCTSNPSLPANNSPRNTFRGCRAWLNSDDGWDLFGTDNEIHFEGCWSFWNSIKPWGTTNNQPVELQMTPGTPSLFKTNSAYWVNMGSTGEGFKLGPARVANGGSSAPVAHFLQNCVAFENRGTGFASNSISSLTRVHQLWNCTSYANDNDGFSFGAGWCAGTYQRFKNNWAWGNNRQASGADWVYDGVNSTNISNNYWDTFYGGVNYGNLKATIGQMTASDLLSVNSLGMDGPRQADGSLPVLNFLKLSASSRLINKGVNVGLPFTGSAPDLGAFES